MKVYEENKKNKEMLFKLTNSGNGIDLDLVDESGMYVATFLSIKNGYINVSSGIKQMLEKEGYNSEELYFSPDGSPMLDYV